MSLNIYYISLLHPTTLTFSCTLLNKAGFLWRRAWLLLPSDQGSFAENVILQGTQPLKTPQPDGVWTLSLAPTNRVLMFSGRINAVGSLAPVPSLSTLLHLLFLPHVSPFCPPLCCSVVFSPSGSSPQLPSWTRGLPPSPSFTSSCSCFSTNIISWSTLGGAANRPEPPAGSFCHRRLRLQQLTR